jgi:hypothetical protein
MNLGGQNWVIEGGQNSVIVPKRRNISNNGLFIRMIRVIRGQNIHVGMGCAIINM